MKDKQIKPCPFCGEAASTFQIPKNGLEENRLHPKWEWRNPGMWVIGCWTEMCMGNINYVTMVFLTEDSAIDTWNRRA